MRPPKDLTGRRYGALVVVKEDDMDDRPWLKPAGRRWWCRCDCGMDRSVLGSGLIGGHALSCQTCSTSARNHRLETPHNQVLTPLGWMPLGDARVLWSPTEAAKFRKRHL